MDLLRITLGLSTLLCSLVAGLVFAFTIVVMPGIKNLNDYEYLRVFKGIDTVIQNSQPIFVFVWLGSILTLITTAILGTVQLDGVDRLVLLVAFAAYVFGVQLPTFIVNVPLNNLLQLQDLNNMTELALHEARMNFEVRWIQWNTIRTLFGILSSGLLIVLSIRL